MMLRRLLLVTTLGVSVPWSALALEPPTPEQLARYRADGSLARRVAAAERLGNHLVAPHLVYALSHGAAVSSKADPAVAKGLPSTGTQRVFVLLVDFANYPSHNPASQVDGQMFGDGISEDYPVESLRNFYRRSSHGLLEITGSTLGWYTTPYPRSEVAQTTSGREALIREAVDHFDAEGHDFAQYDNDGDGEVDYFLVIWSGPHDDWAEFWWGYQTRYRNESVVVDGKRLGTYSWQWESYETTERFTPLVTIHETGHALGLPDYYDYDTGVGPGGGVGQLDMMDGNWGDHNCFSKMLLGWLTPEVSSAGFRTFTLPPADEAATAAILMHGNPPQDPYAEYFMVEHRRREGNDTAYPNDGLLIWHVDARLGSGGRFLYDNSYADHKLLRLMEADGLEEVERGLAADAGDFYRPGNLMSSDTTPNSNRYDGAPTTLRVDGITEEGAAMSFAADLGSGCAIYCAAEAPDTAWTGHPVRFSASSQLAACEGTVSFEWDFGDGTGAGAQMLQHRYTEVGMFNWQLEVGLGDASCPREGQLLVCADPRCYRWRPAAGMSSGRTAHAAVALADGRVLVVGGGGPAELYDPRTDSWSAAADPTGTFEYAIGTLLDDGSVLVVGSTPSDPVNAELFDPLSGTWRPTGQLANDRVEHTALRLADGRVLVAGGVFAAPDGSTHDVLEAEVYDPSSGTWSDAGSIGEGMVGPALTPLADGRVLLTGNQSALFFDPSDDTWTATRNMLYERQYHVAAPLPDGRVVVIGGTESRRAEVFFPTTRVWFPIGTLSRIRIAPAATLLPSGRVLVSGGADWSLLGSVTAEILDPATLAFSPVAAMVEPRLAHQATLLDDGTVLVTGGSAEVGDDLGPGLATVERFAPPDPWVPDPRRPHGRLGPTP